MVIVWILLALVVAALLLFVVRPALRRRAIEAAPTQGVGDMPPCKETCDIHGKVGEPIRYDCGHDDAPEFKIDLWGEPTFHKKPGAGKLYCSDCLLKEVLADSIRCGSCGYAIMPGKPVSMCVDDGSGKKAWRTVFDGQLVLCLRWACDAAPGYCGHWTGKGIKPLFEDGGNVISQAAKTRGTVFIEIGPLEDRKEDA